MKKIFTILAMVVSASAFAGGAGLTTEFESEYSRNGGSDSNSISLAPYYKFDNGIKADVKFEGGRDHGTTDGSNKPIDGLIEARVRKDFNVVGAFYAGLRLGIGEKMNGENKAGQTVDFTYYTVEPMFTYKATDALSFNTSVRFRNAFDTSAVAYKTTTYKVGTAYKITNQDEVGVKFFEKYGDSRTNGFEVAYTRGF
jgi:hypothetical protein